MASSIKYCKSSNIASIPFFLSMHNCIQHFIWGLVIIQYRKICYSRLFSGLSIWTQSSNILLNLKRVTALCSRDSDSAARFLNIFIFCIKSTNIQSSDNHIRCTDTLHEHEKDVVMFLWHENNALYMNQG